MYCSCRPSKVSVLTVAKPDQFDINCNSTVMHRLDLGGCSFILSETLFYIFPCLPYWAHRWNKAASSPAASGSLHCSGQVMDWGLLKMHAAGTLRDCVCLWREFIGNATETSFVNFVWDSCLLYVSVRAKLCVNSTTSKEQFVVYLSSHKLMSRR